MSILVEANSDSESKTTDHSTTNNGGSSIEDQEPSDQL